MNDTKVGLVRLDDIQFHQHNVRRDLGDLRTLVDSIKQFGVMQPVVLEDNGDRLRIRAGHRRVAAARIAGLTRIPALIHRDVLDDDEWLMQAVHENTRRRNLSDEDREKTIAAMRESGLTWQGVADAFGVSMTTIQRVRGGDRAAKKKHRVYVTHLERFVETWRGTDDAAAVLDALDRLIHPDQADDSMHEAS